MKAASNSWMLFIFTCEMVEILYYIFEILISTVKFAFWCVYNFNPDRWKVFRNLKKEGGSLYKKCIQGSDTGAYSSEGTSKECEMLFLPLFVGYRRSKKDFWW